VSNPKLVSGHLRCWHKGLETYLADGTRVPPSFQHHHRLRTKVSIHCGHMPSGSISRSLPIKFVAADAGFLPPGPCTDFADMLCSVVAQEIRKIGVARNGDQEDRELEHVGLHEVMTLKEQS